MVNFDNLLNNISSDDLFVPFGRITNINSSNIIVGAGSDQIIEFCVHAKCTKKI